MPFYPPDENQLKSVILRIIDEIPANLPTDKIEMLVKESTVRYFREMQIASLRSDMAEASRHLYDLGFFPGTSGNISVKLPDNSILITPSGMSKKSLEAQCILRTTHEGEILESSDFKPSSEIKMHIKSYNTRPDIGAIVHAHPPFSTGLAASGISPDTSILPEALLILGEVPLVEYGTPSTHEIPMKLEPYLKKHNAFIMENHGALTLGKDLAEASHRMETLEFFAKVLFISRMFGGEKKLSNEKINELFKVHNRNNQTTL
jgi:L-fuculose-phosphate aldolase